MGNYYILEISGKNPKQFLKYLYKNKINVWHIKYYQDTIVIKVSYFDYLNILRIKTTYQIKIIDIKGYRKIKWLFSQYKLFYLFFIISIFIIIGLSNFVFKINYLNVDEELQKLIKEELTNNNLTIYSLKKSYHELNSIKSSIKHKYNDKIEWIEIEPIGVTYNIKAIKRIINSDSEDNTPSNIVASKDGIILSIRATSGEVVKSPGDYVKKGDIVVSGIIKNKEDIVNIKRSKAKVYAEVWYKVTIKHPTTFEVKVISGKNKIFYYLEILGKKIFNRNNNYELLNKKNIITTKTFNLVKEEKSPFVVKKEKHNNQELLKMIEDKAYYKIKKSLKNDEDIILQKTLKKSIKDGKMIVEVFFKVKENITKEELIDLTIEEEKYD